MIKKLILLIFILAPLIVSAQEYEESGAKIKYNIDNNIWIEQPLTSKKEFIQKKWHDNNCEILLYGSKDVWNEIEFI